MGTTCLQHRGEKTANILARELFGNTCEAVQHHAHGNTHYYAVKHKPTDKYFGLVVKTSRTREELCYKEMDETMGPYYYDAPASLIHFLNAQSPVDPLSIEGKWREWCLAKALSRAAKPKLNAGLEVTLGDVKYKLLAKIGKATWRILDPSGHTWRCSSRRLLAAL